MSSTTKTRFLSRLLILLALLVGVQGMTAAQSGDLQYVTWSESNNDFSFDIPYGWTVEAYIVDVLGARAPYVYVFEPEERAVIIAGVPSSTLYLDSSAYAQGEQVTLDGYTVTVSPYQTPAEYLEDYLRTEMLPDACETIFIVLIADAEPTDEGSTAAEITLECHADGSYTNGVFYLQTMSAEVENVGTIWIPTDFYGYLAEPQLEGQAEAALLQMANSFYVSERMTQPQQTTVVNNTDAPVNQTTDDGYDPDAFLQAQQELYQQQQTTQFLSNMMQMQHQTSMAIINNIGSSSYTYDYEWVWTP